MAFVTAPDFSIRSIDWSLDRPAQINVSGWTGRRTVVANPWHGKWRAHVELAPIITEDSFRTIRSFFARCKGSVNTFRIYATAGAQNSNSGVTVASTAAAGATTMTISGADTPLSDGQYFTVNGQLCICTADQSGSTLTFEPPLRAEAAAGTTVVTARPYALVYLVQSAFGFNISPGRLFGMSFDVEEALLETDGSAPELSEKQESELWLDYANSEYWQGGSLLASLSSASGYSFTRSGTQGAVDSDSTIDSFAANTPAINGNGFHCFAGLTNLLLNAGSSSTLSTQSVTVSATAYTLAFIGTGSITLSGVASGTVNGTGATSQVVHNFTPTAGSLTLTVTGTVEYAVLVAGTIGANVPIIATTGATAAIGASDLEVGASLSGDFIAWAVVNLGGLPSTTAAPFSYSTGGSGSSSERVRPAISTSGDWAMVNLTAGGVEQSLPSTVTGAVTSSGGRIVLMVRRRNGKFSLACRKADGTVSIGADGSATATNPAITAVQIGATYNASQHLDGLVEFFGQRDGTFTDAYITSLLESA